MHTRKTRVSPFPPRKMYSKYVEPFENVCGRSLWNSWLLEFQDSRTRRLFISAWFISHVSNATRARITCDGGVSITAPDTPGILDLSRRVIFSHCSNALRKIILHFFFRVHAKRYSRKIIVLLIYLLVYIYENRFKSTLSRSDN